MISVSQPLPVVELCYVRCMQCRATKPRGWIFDSLGWTRRGQVVVMFHPRVVGAVLPEEERGSEKEIQTAQGVGFYIIQYLSRYQSWNF